MADNKEKFKKEKEIFLEHIQKEGLRRTAQRDLILEIFLRTEDHLTSEDLYWLVQKDDPLAREVRFGDNKTYYEHHYNHAHHDHMICTECGKVIEFFSEELEAMQDAMADKFNFKPTHHSLRIWGLCEQCQMSEKDLSSAAPGAQPRVRVRTTIN
jgi:Fur family transcriptional regulator, ferric uptake regulator